jgi:hypothetical protein
VKRIILSAAAVFAVATAAHAGELSDIHEQSKQLREQNQALTKRIADLERRQRKLEAQPAKQPAVAARPANPGDSMAADLAYKAEYKKAPVNDSLTWNGITLYGLVDMGVTYQNHGAPLSSTAGLGLNYLISKNSNGSYFGIGGNALTSSFVGLKGNVELTEGLNGVFNLQTGFNPWSGRLSDGLGSIVQTMGCRSASELVCRFRQGRPGVLPSLRRSELADIWNADLRPTKRADFGRRDQL